MRMYVMLGPATDQCIPKVLLRGRKRSTGCLKADKEEEKAVYEV